MMILKLISLWCDNQITRNEMKYVELEKKLKKAGCCLVRKGKRHPIWFSPLTGKEFALSYHGGEEVKPGTLKSISNDSGVKL